jgi:selenide,water dikinase
VGAQVLADALRELPPQNRADIVLGLGARDDAAVTTLPPNCAAVHTIDGFRSFVTDPFVFGQIVAAHALSDVFAMGAQAQSALAYVTLPLAAPALVRRDLATLMAGALRVLNAEGAQLVGGHTGEGAELALALAINGYIEPQRLRVKDSLALGDVLILTKALGTGVIMAGDMRGAAKPAWVDAALAQMVQTNGPAARALRNLDIHAMTDITGFGLAGHLREMLRSGGLGARLTLAKLPVLAGARELLAAGIRSTLHAQNEPLDVRIAVSDHAADAADFALLFDPQTSGGLLVAVPPGSLQACLVALRAAGAGAAVIGQIFSRPNLA